jgi:hypothetical protein
MNTDTRIIDAIMSAPTIHRRKLRNDAQRFAMDWGGDYTILTTAEVRKLNKMNNR